MTWRRKSRLDRRWLADKVNRSKNGPVVVVQEAITPLVVEPDQKRYASAGQRLEVLQRDRYRCRYCRVKLTNETANIDHKKPWAHGGKTVLENLVACCQPCNKRKGNN